MEAKLVVLNGKAQGREIPLPSTQFIIGRTEDCHLRLHSTLVSKVHCAIGRQNGQVVIRDLKSRNKTYINGEPISTPTYIKDGDVLRIGPVEFRFQIASADNVSAGVQVIRSDRVRWLMESSEPGEANGISDSTVELPAGMVSEEELEKHESSSSEPAAEADSGEDSTVRKQIGNKEMSSGERLHNYFQSRE